MNPGELLKPRIKVIAYFWHNPFEIGIPNIGSLHAGGRATTKEGKKIMLSAHWKEDSNELTNIKIIV